VDVVAWGKQAEALANYTSKGSLIMVEGRIQTRDYETPDGQKRHVVEVVSERVQFLDNKKASAATEREAVAVP
jgi:single-strand DNA-binding protein